MCLLSFLLFCVCSPYLRLLSFFAFETLLLNFIFAYNVRYRTYLTFKNGLSRSFLDVLTFSRHPEIFMMYARQGTYYCNITEKHFEPIRRYCIFKWCETFAFKYITFSQRVELWFKLPVNNFSYVGTEPLGIKPMEKEMCSEYPQSGSGRLAREQCGYLI